MHPEARDVVSIVQLPAGEMMSPLHSPRSILCTLTSMDSLAVTYSEQGQWQQAEKLNVQIKKRRRN